MKYMTFRSSCSYAGLSNMLCNYGIETTDREIALTMKLPFLFAKEADCYLSGPMLQSAEWFNLYLHPLGLHMDEIVVPKNQVPTLLKEQESAMLGIHAEHGKHAMIYTGFEHGKFRLLNNKWQAEDAPEELCLTAGELLEHLEALCHIAVLSPVPPVEAPIRVRMEASIPVLDAMGWELYTTCEQRIPRQAIIDRMNTLFRPLFLDGITMLELIGEIQLAGRLKDLQSGFLNALRSGNTELRLFDYLSFESLDSVLSDYRKLIHKELERMNTNERR